MLYVTYAPDCHLAAEADANIEKSVRWAVALFDQYGSWSIKTSNVSVVLFVLKMIRENKIQRDNVVIIVGNRKYSPDDSGLLEILRNSILSLPIIWYLYEQYVAIDKVSENTASSVV